MDCHKLQIKMLRQEELDQDEARHLQTCADCRAYQRLLNRLGDHATELQAPPPKLDRAVREYAWQEAGRRRRLKRTIRLKLAASAAVALICLLLGMHLVGVFRAPATDDEAPGNNVVAGNDETAPGTDRDDLRLVDVRDDGQATEAALDAELAAVEADFLFLVQDAEDAEIISQCL